MRQAEPSAPDSPAAEPAAAAHPQADATTPPAADELPATGESIAPAPGADFGREQLKPPPAAKLSNITSTVAAVRRKDREEMIFLLDNGQIWIQDVFRFMTVDVGDQITIRRGRMGGYVLTTERGASTRVQRIR